MGKCGSKTENERDCWVWRSNTENKETKTENNKIFLILESIVYNFESKLEKEPILINAFLSLNKNEKKHFEKNKNGEEIYFETNQTNEINISDNFHPLVLDLNSFKKKKKNTISIFIKSKINESKIIFEGEGALEINKLLEKEKENLISNNSWSVSLQNKNSIENPASIKVSAYNEIGIEKIKLQKYSGSQIKICDLILNIESIKYVFDRKYLENYVSINITVSLENEEYHFKVNSNNEYLVLKLNEIEISDYFSPLELKLENLIKQNAHLKLVIVSKNNNSEILFEGEGRFNIGEYFGDENKKKNPINSWSVSLQNKNSSENTPEIQVSAFDKSIFEKIKLQKYSGSQKKICDLILNIESINYVFDRKYLENYVSINITVFLKNREYHFKVNSNNEYLVLKLNEIDISDYFSPLELKLENLIKQNAHLKLVIVSKNNNSEILFEGEGSFNIGEYFGDENKNITSNNSWSVSLQNKNSSENPASIKVSAYNEIGFEKIILQKYSCSQKRICDLNLYIQSIKYVFERKYLENYVSINITVLLKNREYHFKVSSNNEQMVLKLNQINISDYFSPLDLKLENLIKQNAQLKLVIVSKNNNSEILFEGEGSFNIGDYFEDENKKKNPIYSWTVYLAKKSSKEDFAEINLFANEANLNKEEIITQIQGRFYDLILKINSFEEFHKDFKSIIIKQNILELIKLSKLVVSIYGYFNNGKTYILDRLINVGLPEGDDIHTEGDSLKLVSFTSSGKITYNQVLAKKNVLFMDLAGQNVPFRVKSKEDLSMKLMGTDFLKRMTFSYSDVIIFVCGRMTNVEKNHLLNIPIQFKNIKNIIVIHNFKDISDEDSFNKLCKLQIENQFNVKQAISEVTTDSSNNKLEQYKCNYYEGTEESLRTLHFAVCDESSELGKKINTSVFQKILSLLMLQNVKEKKLFYEHVRTELNNYLKLLANDKSNKNDFIDLNGNASIDNTEIKLKRNFDSTKFKTLSEDETGSSFVDSNPESVCYISECKQFFVVEVYKIGESNLYENVKAEYIPGRIIISIKKKKNENIPNLIKDILKIDEYSQEEDFQFVIDLRKELKTYNFINIHTKNEVQFQNGKIIFKFDLSYKSNFNPQPGQEEKKKVPDSQLVDLPKIKNLDKLDAVICLASIKQLFESGARFISKFTLNEEKMSKEIGSKFIAVLSDNNVRKIDLINLLSGKQDLIHEINNEASGRLCFYKTENYVYVYYDSVSELIINKGSFTDSIKINKLFINIITDLCQAILYITHHITRSQMIYIQKLKEIIDPSKKIYIIHYFHSFSNQASIVKKIKECIMDPFEVKEKEMVSRIEYTYNVWETCYIESNNENVEHFIMVGDKNLKDIYNLKLRDYLNINLDNLSVKSGINYNSIFEILKNKIFTNTQEAKFDFSNLKNNSIKIFFSDYQKFLVNIEDIFLTYTPKILRSVEKKSANEKSETIIINIIILKSNYSEMKITSELIVDNSFHVLKIKGSKKKLFLSNNFNQCEIIKDEQITGNILINERLTEENDHTQSNGIILHQDEKEFILIKVEFLKTIIV